MLATTRWVKYSGNLVVCRKYFRSKVSVKNTRFLANDCLVGALGTRGTRGAFSFFSPEEEEEEDEEEESLVVLVSFGVLMVVVSCVC